MTTVNRYKSIIFIVTLLLIATYAKASTYMDVGDDVYDILHRLEAEGIINSGLLTTKPLSRKEVIRLTIEAESNSEGKSPFIRRQVQLLKDEFKCDMDSPRYIRPVDKINATYIQADDEPSELSYNNDGDDYDDGSNFRFDVVSRAELGWFSFYMNPEIRYSDGDKTIIMDKVYGVVELLGMELEVGSDSQWWGPGHHGSILLSNNPEPMTMVKLTNSRPVLLPWIFKYLGLFKFTGFATKLEKNRVVPEPYLWGMRLNFKISPYFEFGLQRTALFGGKGRPSGFSTWWDSFWGKGENSPDGPGDQRGGYDIKLTLPFDLQPFQLYMDANGEDEAGGLPSNWAYIYGLYLPRVLDFERIGFRAEYADNHVSGKPNVWYNHHIYQSGYTYKGRIIGHHMGTDSEDMFIEASYLVPELNGKISVAYDRKEHNLSGAVKEKKDEFFMTVDMDLIESLRIKASYGYGKIENLGNISGIDENISTFIVQFSYDF